MEKLAAHDVDKMNDMLKKKEKREKTANENKKLVYEEAKMRMEKLKDRRNKAKDYVEKGMKDNETKGIKLYN